MGTQTAGLIVRFVLRGKDGAGLVAEESTSYRDITFVDADAMLDRSVGPLVTLLEWYMCALRKWPDALLIGKSKSDDDVRSNHTSHAWTIHRTIACWCVGVG